MSTDDLVLTYLRRAARTDDAPPTAGEIADWLTRRSDAPVTTETIGKALHRLEAAGRVRRLGNAFNGARTWALTDTADQPTT